MAKRLVIDAPSFIRELQKPRPKGRRQALKQASMTEKDLREKAGEHRRKLDLRAILRKLGV